MNHRFVEGEDLPQATIEYWHDQGLADLIAASEKHLSYSPFFGVATDLHQPYPPEIPDLVRLHRVLRSRRVFTVLEFGIGYSTLVMADAIDRNRRDFSALVDPPALRNSAAWTIHAVDTSAEWVERAAARFPARLASILRPSVSRVSMAEVNGQICHLYDAVPNVIPDFIYLDGPSASEVRGSIRGIDFSIPERTVMAADLIGLEPTLLPGCFLVVDGRTNNARFLARNFRRKWRVHHDERDDVTEFDLMEAPLGVFNRRAISYCLGPEWLASAESGKSA